MTQNLLNNLYKRKAQGQKSFAVLIDPDKVNLDNFSNLLNLCTEYGADYIFVGGSLITNYVISEVITQIKKQTNIPVIIFPGNSLHIDNQADAILLLSLISGRNPEFLIGQHVISAPLLRKSGLEILPTGYMLIDSGKPTTVSYISNTTPIPHDKAGIAACTAMAGEMLGLKLTYLDAGSGAINPVSPEMIAAVRQSVDTPIIVGGGINTAKKAKNALSAGADVIVVGNGIEQNIDLLKEIAISVNSYQLSVTGY
ncbi:geranylgeranylglyceryl/heptaprenylglyceryl phosphate synthase [Arcicella sp. LKC2W]|uniref:geranylgeranylglyceryl/heptaprenylglyceryl phosphate synthase n=1 Tax=Arcicella sp. LKC2W TaxID=2984198 RepID=UPI002B210D8D|nr:geranylgeranylglyceryl/heptaprenylglyceryl phosphate synthase [Arcicella sp. LKC2W]MEA5459630.1 geranylgeranylglyceryl/heptaprenylglyceryl phosphate synthase [Arcicella sp. LKC2W]